MGAGLLGCLVALGASQRGARVLLLDRKKGPLLGASGVGEGKVHLGYLFARDRPERTARLMVDGAFAFADILTRYCHRRDLERHVTTPFVYRVMPSSLSTPAELAAFYREVDTMIAAQVREGRGYLGQTDLEPVARLPADDTGSLGAFATPERAVDPVFLRQVLSEAIESDPAIETLYGCEVVGLAQTAGGAPSPITTEHGMLGPFDRTVNATWEDRLKLDASLGHRSERAHLHRRKVAIAATSEREHTDIASTTLVLGAYGDVVSYDAKRFYLSWYPTGCVARTDALAPPDDWQRPLEPCVAERVLADAVTQLSAFVPGLAALFDAPVTFHLDSGVVFSWGSGDVDQPSTELHQRFDVGPQTIAPGYVSVDTGKLTTAPLFAERTVEMVMA